MSTPSTPPGADGALRHPDIVAPKRYDWLSQAETWALRAGPSRKTTEAGLTLGSIYYTLSTNQRRAPCATPSRPSAAPRWKSSARCGSLGHATAREVHDRILARRRLAYTTVMTVMKNLADKGYLRYEAEGTAYVYTAARAPEEVRGSVLSGILEKVFGGSATGLVQALVQREDLSEADRAEIRRLIDQMDDEGSDA